jgi:hypothetical protein
LARVVAIVVLAFGLAGAAGLAGPAIRHAKAQDELPAAVVRGDCNAPGEVVTELRPLAVAEGGVRTSFSTIDLAIDELTSGGYAIVVGDPGSASACGEIAGQGTDVYVAVQERSGSNLGGIAWLHARNDRTQVSLFVGEGLGGSATAAPTEEPDGPPEPPTDETPEPTEPAGEAETYISPTFGYTIAYDSELWRVTENTTMPLDNGPSDYFVIRNQEGSIQTEFIGLPTDPSDTADQYTNRFLQQVLADPDLSEASVRTDADGKPILGGDDDKAYVAIDFSMESDTAGTIKNTYHAICWRMSSAGGVLVMIFQTPQDEYDDWAPAREALEQGVTLPS